MKLGAVDRELDELVAIARRAAAIVRAVYATPFEVVMKSPGDPVTIADRQANDLICEALARSFPGDAVIAEESAPESRTELAELLRHERVFFVDPLDGTREFAARNGEFAVMIGMSAAGRPELGVLVMPTTGLALAGRVGGACFAEDEDGARRPITTSSESDCASARIMVSRSRPARVVGRIRSRLHIAHQIECGSVGAKVAYVAEGRADLYVHGGGGAKRWDTCGPEALILAAGGRFTDLDGAPIDYTSADLTIRSGIIASNGRLHDEVVAVARAERNNPSPSSRP